MHVMVTLLPRRRMTLKATSKRQIEAAARLVRSVEVSRRYLAALGPGEKHTKRAGLGQPDYAVLNRSMEKVAKMSEDERARAMQILPPNQDGLPHQALQLRISGMPYWQIAEEMGQREDTVKHWVLEQLQRLNGEEVRNSEIARQLHLERLDALLRGSWMKALQGNADSATIVLRCMERSSKLLGLDAPQKVDITHRLRLMAEQEGLDYEELLAEAQAVIKALPPR